MWFYSRAMWWWCRRLLIVNADNQSDKLKVAMRRFSIGAFIASACLTSSITCATDFTYAPSAKTRLGLSDNIRGATSGSEGAIGFDMGANIDLKAQSQTLTSEVIPAFNVRRFAAGRNLDADEYSVTINNNWLQESYTTGVNFSYARDSTLSTLATERGFRNDVTDRDTVSVQPSAVWYATDKIAMNVSGLFNDVSYLSAATAGFVDYRFLQGSSGFTYLFRENAQTFANFFVTDFDAPSQQSKTRSYGGQAGLTWRWDPTFETTGAVGWISSNIEFVDRQLALVLVPFPQITTILIPRSTSTSGPIANVNIRKAFESMVAKFDFSRQVSPSGRGSESSADRMALQVEKRLSDQLIIRVEGIYEIRTAQAADVIVGSGGIDLNRDAAELRGSVRYQFAPQWALSAGYQFGHSVDANVNSSASVTINSVNFIIEYNGLPKTFWDGF